MYILIGDKDPCDTNLHCHCDIIFIVNPLGDTSLDMPLRKFTERFDWRRKPHSSCCCTITWAGFPGWIRRGEMSWAKTHLSLFLNCRCLILLLSCLLLHDGPSDHSCKQALPPLSCSCQMFGYSNETNNQCSPITIMKSNEGENRTHSTHMPCFSHFNISAPRGPNFCCGWLVTLWQSCGCQSLAHSHCSARPLSCPRWHKSGNAYSSGVRFGGGVHRGSGTRSLCCLDRRYNE